LTCGIAREEIMITELHHTGFVVRDLEKAIGFYRNVIGLRLIAEMERTGGPISQVVGYENTHLKIGKLAVGDGHFLELIEYVNPTAGARPTDERCVLGGSHLAFEVDDIEATYRQLTSRGANKLNPPVEVAPGRKACYLQDPEGNWIELVELREEEPA
jgi:catechol 2,3-dioxygenase-like lactoylglutathione lyase family enzyme